MNKAPLGKELQLRDALSMAIDRDTLVEEDHPGRRDPGLFLDAAGRSGLYAAEARLRRHALQGASGRGEEAPEGRRLWPGQAAARSTSSTTPARTIRRSPSPSPACGRRIGVQAKLTNQEWKVYLDTRKHDYTVARAGWIGDYLDPSDFMEQYMSDAGDSNFIHYNNKDYDGAPAPGADRGQSGRPDEALREGRGDLPQRPAADPDLSLRAPPR